MPFASNADLPDRVRSRFSEHEQTVWRKAFNSAFDGVCKDGGRQRDREGCSFAVAATAVKQAKGAHMAKDPQVIVFDDAELSALTKAILDLALADRPWAFEIMDEIEKALHPGPCPPGQHRDETGKCVPEKKGEEKKAVSWIVPIAKVDEERRLVASVVYEPGVADAHDDAMSAEEIERSCHGFGIRYAQGRGELGTDHARKANRLEIVPVESFLAPVDLHLGAQLVTKGSWVMWSKVLDDELWKGVKSGEYTGYSFEGWGRRVPAA